MKQDQHLSMLSRQLCWSLQCILSFQQQSSNHPHKYHLLSWCCMSRMTNPNASIHNPKWTRISRHSLPILWHWNELPRRLEIQFFCFCWDTHQTPLQKVFSWMICMSAAELMSWWINRRICDPEAKKQVVLFFSGKRIYSGGEEWIHFVMWLKTATVSISENPRRRPE